MESSSVSFADQPAAHPVNVTVNPLQLLWLQECGIDRLWGRPLVASPAAAGKHPVHGQQHVGTGTAAFSPAAAGVAPVRPSVPSIGAAQEPAAPAVPASQTEASPARQALAKLRQQMERQRGRPAQRNTSNVRVQTADSVGTAASPANPAPIAAVPLSAEPATEAFVAQRTEPPVVLRADNRNALAEWPILAETILRCTRCGLSEHARQPVPGTGAATARLMIIDQAPGAQDEISGEPLSGQAGRLMDNMLAAIGLERGSVFITDVVKCRPMVNRPPEPHEIEACADYLQQQIALVQPSCVLLFGTAAQSVLGTTQSVGQLREMPSLAITVQGRQIPVVVTFHPNHLMANQAAKPLAWADLKQLRKILEAAAPRQ